MIENLKKSVNPKNLLIITIGLIICYILCNIFLYENFGSASPNDKPLKKIAPGQNKLRPKIVPIILNLIRIPVNWSVDSNNNIVKSALTDQGSMIITVIPGNKKVKQVYTDNKNVWAIGLDKNIYKCVKPCNNGKWEIIQAPVDDKKEAITIDQLIIIDKGILALNTQNDEFGLLFYRMNSSTSSGPDSWIFQQKFKKDISIKK
jgi:hypothetical protein